MMSLRMTCAPARWRTRQVVVTASASTQMLLIPLDYYGRFAQSKKCVSCPEKLRAVSSLVSDAPTTHVLARRVVGMGRDADYVNETWGAVQSTRVRRAGGAL